MIEEYREIKDFPNYEVSNLGNVRNIKTKRILKARENKKLRGYICYEVHLYNDITDGNKKIHRLVAEAFLPNPENKPEIDHLDRNPANNNVNNLRYATRSENCLNTKTRCDNSLGERNICFNNLIKRFQVEIRRDKKQVFYSSYNTLEEAKKARDDFNNGLIKDTHQARSTNTGQKNITQRGNNYRLDIEKNKIRLNKTFPTLQEAIIARDKFLNQ